MTIKSVAHVCIKTTDLEATAKFYCGELGLQRLFDFTRQGQIIGYYLKTENLTFVEVFSANVVDKIDKQVLSHFCLETSDIKGLRQKMEDHGHKPGPIIMGCDDSYQFWMDDPNGMPLEFHEYTPTSAQFTGATVEVNW